MNLKPTTKRGHLGEILENLPKHHFFSELPADLVTGRGIHGVGRVEASAVWGIGMERVAMTFRKSCRSKKNHPIYCMGVSSNGDTSQNTPK